MKTLKFVIAPTRNRRLNELLGLLMLVAAGLLLLSIVSYHPTDPSLNTATGFAGPRSVHNWAGIVGSVISDLLLQVEGVTALWFPILLAMLGVSWMRSRPVGSPWAKLVGAGLILTFGPAIFALVPGHLHWMHGLPIEGLTGRLVADSLVQYLNFPGACIVAVTMVAAALYLSTTFSFNTAKEWLAVRFAFVQAWRDRWTNWKAARARKRELRQAVKEDAARAKEFARAQKAASKAGKLTAKEPKIQKAVAVQPVRVAEVAEEVSRPRQGGFAEMYDEPAPVTSLWDAMPRAQMVEAEVEELVEEPKPQLIVPRRTEPVAAPPPKFEPKFDSRSIAVGERADADVRTVTVTPKSVSGFKLPPSTLLHRSEDSQVVREDELRIEAQVLVEKCGEFDVRGQVVQINPGPVVTTFEFRPEAGVKYSRVTGLAEDLCLAT
jgi:S-DNA-T family DNA segregation ATPase FtsK/SpoIIIE